MPNGACRQLLLAEPVLKIGGYAGAFQAVGQPVGRQRRVDNSPAAGDLQLPPTVTHSTKFRHIAAAIALRRCAPQ